MLVRDGLPVVSNNPRRPLVIEIRILKPFRHMSRGHRKPRLDSLNAEERLLQTHEEIAQRSAARRARSNDHASALTPLQRANIATRERLEALNQRAADLRRNGFWNAK